MHAELLRDWEAKFEAFAIESMESDAAHDMAHIRRVVANAKQLARAEQAELAVVLPAAWLHDCVVVPKTSPLRNQASRMAAERAVEWLGEQGYPEQYFSAIEHAIAAHSFSAQIPTETLEAQVVQDADRLDAIGAIGMGRCLMLGGQFGSQLYCDDDPFCTERTPEDTKFSVDHFYTKLLRLAGTMQTLTGRQIAQQRTEFMQGFLDQLGLELTGQA